MSKESDQRQQHAPLMSPYQTYEEINTYVVVWGLFFAVLFALAVGYLALKIGQTVDAFAPVSVLAMGMAVIFHRKNAFPETVHIQAIASAGTNVLGGAMFILPALYILGIEDLSFLEMSVPIVLGGVLGVFLATVFRRYFCEEMDGIYPFPSVARPQKSCSRTRVRKRTSCCFRARSRWYTISCSTRSAGGRSS